MAIRVLLLTQWFDPEPTFKGLVFARELLRRGYEVEVVTGFPNYPGGKVYPGYRVRLLQREFIDGVHVTRVPLYPNHDQSAFRRVLNYASFALSSLVYCLCFAKRPSIIYAYHPPLTVGITAALVRLFRRVPVVYDIQDMWPDTLRATGMISSPRLLSMVGRVCKWVYRRVDHLVVLSPGFKQLLLSRGVTDRPIEVIYNWCSEDAITSAQGNVPSQFPDSSAFRILFAGNMGPAQALDAVLGAAAILRGQPGRVTFIFVGGGIEVEHLKRVATEQGLENVLFLPPVPMDEVGAVLGAADALLVHLRRDPLFEITIPSKTQAYMAAGRPILMAVEGDAAALVEESGCGVIARPEDPQSIAAAALQLAAAGTTQRAAMADAARKFYEQRLSLRVGAARFGRIFETLAGGARV
jgi:glycosyltransferase involved in cell wall biosynthesis